MINNQQQVKYILIVNTTYQLAGNYCILIGSSVDFDSDSINVTFAAGKVSQSFNISVTCDKIVEGMERFDVSLTLTSNNPQVGIGRNRSLVRIIDSTGK